MALLPVVSVVALRWVDPIRTPLMLSRGWTSPACDRVDFEWIDHSALPPHVGWSALAAEDQRFWEHQGFDYGSIQQAVQDSRDGRRLRGASTISQQVAKNLWLWPQRSWVRKAFEAYLTVWVEALWPKQRILEIYLNVAQFGSCTFGVEAASQRFFQKSAARLTEHEAARLMTALPAPLSRRPDRPSPALQRRASQIREQARMLERRWPGAL